ncbi:hypothetical protein Caci_3118 [Catenulispora acidiphila DSM 44928]|uniref:Uncharacterized protein n=1 Tax=Catenulispora acidiphila (strain DSM 44928 / JCM 14897 / NBRC 102108 / NRRL B-24433 / ID139908) TaxID=479433 RepID=C7Q4Q8_CATAD|nr:hypothetical protein [Catenulispora acidiphila]ACU72027.1 hypothetical protein Caci_3118 [Catenulispora acidiphila DSM 44928]
MTNTEELPDQTARDLFTMMFDEGGTAVPSDDLAPAAMAGYRRHRRRRTALVGAGTTAAVVGIASVALAMGGGTDRSGTAPAVTVRTDASAPHTSPMPTGAGQIVDCVTNFVPESGSTKESADCQRAGQLWQAVFPGGKVSGARDPGIVQITPGFLARVSAQKADAPALYGHAQPQVVKDWADAKAADANAGDQFWSGFDIATPQGTIMVSAVYPGTSSRAQARCMGESPCDSVPLSDGSTAEVSGAAGVPGYRVVVRSHGGDVYRFTFTSWYDPRYVAIPCSAPNGQCFADLADGSILPGTVPSTSALIGEPVVTHAVLTDILNRPAFAALVQGFFDGKLGQPG